jgi:putative SOS response-associated peptidase YedK
MLNAMVNHIGDLPLERYNAAPTTRFALFHQGEGFLQADMMHWGWRPHWAKNRVAPINTRVEKVAHGPFFTCAFHEALRVTIITISVYLRASRSVTRNDNNYISLPARFPKRYA